MLRRVLSIAAAYVGLVVGAGFASGQEVLQYFVAHGVPGLWGAVISAVILALTGMIILQLGSYFQAKEHSAVFEEVAHRVTSKALDVFIIFTLFCMGFVMIAGAGSNLEQQFGLPTWVGSALMALLVIVVGRMDVSKVTAVIGGITPFIMVFIIGAGVYAIANAAGSVASLEPRATALSPAIGNWFISANNYVAMALSLAVSMAIVMGGDLMHPRAAGVGGLLGGLTFGALLVLATVALYLQIPVVADAEMPMLELVDAIHPVLGVIMSVVIYGMIFNTALGMYYALAKRVAGRRESWFEPALIILTIIGFGLSFVGFKTLVAYLYPIIGYVGMVLIAILVAAWLKQRATIREESQRRTLIQRLGVKKLDATQDFSAREQKRLDAEIAESNIDDDQLRDDMEQEIVAVIESDENAEVDESVSLADDTDTSPGN
ncbi:MAG: hypothetical protein Q4P36_02250 [Bowdeniella nasicola]|nr:hypothetical protein [Bowdeniella nasicola]